MSDARKYEGDTRQLGQSGNLIPPEGEMVDWPSMYMVVCVEREIRGVMRISNAISRS